MIVPDFSIPPKRGFNCRSTRLVSSFLHSFEPLCPYFCLMDISALYHTSREYFGNRKALKLGCFGFMLVQMFVLVHTSSAVCVGLFSDTGVHY